MSDDERMEEFIDAVGELLAETWRDQQRKSKGREG